MMLSLSTNWCNRRIDSGEEIADKALELGFSELELGFHTTDAQVEGFRRRIDQIPIGSIHAFCPVPISAPQGYPELYSLASFSRADRELARVHILKNIEFASSIGAATVVLHAGRIPMGTFFSCPGTHTMRRLLEKNGGNIRGRKYMKEFSFAAKVRTRRAAKLLDIFKTELSQLIPALEKNGVVLALENMPYFEGFPNIAEMNALSAEFKGAPVMAWFDTGHDRICRSHGWTLPSQQPVANTVRGLHLNDVNDFYDDHLAPGDGKVDFAELVPLMRTVRHVVFEPNSNVKEERLKAAVKFISGLTDDE